jgi:hypothetical protein
MVTDINRNPALAVNFLLEIPLAKELNYFVQTVDVPGLTMAGVETPYRNVQANVPSNRIDYDQLNLAFIVDENWANWNYVFEWMKRIRTGNSAISDTMTDITLNLVNSNKNLNKIMVFRGAYPTLLGSLPLDSTVVDSNPLVCSLSFRYQDFELRDGT